MTYTAQVQPVSPLNRSGQGATVRVLASTTCARTRSTEYLTAGGGGYSTWMDFDGNGQGVQDDPARHDYNVDQWVDKFVQDALSQVLLAS